MPRKTNPKPIYKIQTNWGAKLAFLIVVGLVGTSLVYLTRAQGPANPISCPVKGKPTHSTNTAEGGGGYGAGRPGTRTHAGVDFGANSAGVQVGTPIHAAENGKVTAYGSTGAGGYGLYADLKGDSGYTYRYAHLSAIKKTGRVSQGEVIALSGDSGDGPAHLHFETRDGSGHFNPGPTLARCNDPGGGSSAPPPTANPSAGTSSGTCPEDHPPLRQGSSNRPCVLHLQQELVDAGYHLVLGYDANGRKVKMVDGIFGANTKRAVQRFQYENEVKGSNCPTPIPYEDTATGQRHKSCDGIVGPGTWAKLHGETDKWQSGGGTAEQEGSPSVNTGSSRNNNNGQSEQAPQPGHPGTPGASIRQGTGGRGGSGGIATSPGAVGGNGGNGGSGSCVGGCQRGQDGASNPGSPGASNPGTAIKGTDGADGASGSRGTSGTSGTSGSKGADGKSGSSSVTVNGVKYTCPAGGKCSASSSSGSSQSSTISQPTASSSSGKTGSNYVLRSHLSGRCVDGQDGDKNDDAETWACHGRSNQRWGFASDGTVRVAVTGLCLEARRADTDNGTDVQLYDCNGGSHQRWRWNSNGTIQSIASGKCLDVRDSEKDDGARLQIWSCHGDTNQKWGTW